MRKLKKIIKKYFSNLTYFYRYLRGKIFIIFLLSIVVGILDSLGLSMFFPLLKVLGESGDKVGEGMGKLQYVIDGIRGMGFPLTVVSVLVSMLVFFSLKGAFTYFNQVYVVILQQSFVRKIRLDLLKYFNRMKFKQFITSDVGRIQNTMSGEVNRVSQGFLFYFQTFQKMFMVVIYLGFAFVVDPQFALLVTVCGGLTSFLFKYIYKHTKGASKQLTTHNSEFQGQIIQHVAHFKYLRATGMVERYSKRLRTTIYKVEAARRKIGVLGAIALAVQEPVLVFVIAFVIFIKIQLLGGILGTIILSLLFFFRALQNMTRVQNQWNAFLGFSGSIVNMQDFEKKIKSAKEKKGTKKLIKFDDGIHLDKVDFSYGDKKVLRDINLYIAKNQSIAFVGESGSGKTTLVNLISGLLPEDGGEVHIDNQSLKTINKETYQRRIGYVSQDSVIFNDTIYNNITFWAEQSPENVKRFKKAVKQASLVTLLKELPLGEETKLGNNGINLSGGQKQRVSIARELFKNIDILILDEATSALDSETERTIQNSIDALQGEYTLLIVAHRLATIRNVDEVVLMDKGRIIDQGSFEELVLRQNRFQKMVKLQEL